METLNNYEQELIRLIRNSKNPEKTEEKIINYLLSLIPQACAQQQAYQTQELCAED